MNVHLVAARDEFNKWGSKCSRYAGLALDLNKTKINANFKGILFELAA